NWSGQSAGYFLARSRRGPYRSSHESDKSDMDGKAKYSFSSAGESEQAVRFDCAQSEVERTNRRAMVRIEEPRSHDCSAAEKVVVDPYLWLPRARNGVRGS